MSSNVLWNLLSKLEKMDNMQGLLSILSPYHNEFDKLIYYTGEGMLGSIDVICHMTIKLLKKLHVWRENVIYAPLLWTSVHIVTK